jgi:hypothetical protein
MVKVLAILGRVLGFILLASFTVALGSDQHVKQEQRP